MTRPRLELRKSAIAGTGCYAREPIAKGAEIGEYTGEVITDAEADHRYGDQHDEDATYLFSIDGGKCIDATHADHPLKYINHSCDPNCEATEEDGRVHYHALRDIASGEELTVDYQMIAEEEDAQLCRCGAVRCRGTMKAPKGE